jgi:hypothetical protein
MARLLGWLAACWIFALVALGQADPACAPCGDRGMVACKLCASKPCVSQRGYLHCSVEISCGDCGGARWRDCALCDKAPEKDLGALRAELARWRHTRDSVDEHMARRDILHLDSKHYRLAFDLARSPFKAASNPHEAAHATLDLLERSWDEFVADSGAKPEELTGIASVYLWSGEKDQEKASSKWTLEKSTSVAKLMGAEPVLSLCFGKGRLRDERDLERECAHQLAHLWLSNVHKSVWLGGKKAGWLDEGYAHFCEQRRSGSIEVWCALSAKAQEDIGKWRFESEVLARSADGAVVELASLSGLDTVAIAPAQRLFAWSYVDYIVRAHPARLAQLARVLQSDKPTSEAIQTALGVSLTDFQLAWSTWMKANYSARKR